MAMMPRRIVVGRDGHALINWARSSCRSLVRQHVRRILRRLHEVVFSYLQIVFHRYSHAVADLGRGHVGGELVRQFCLTG